MVNILYESNHAQKLLFAHMTHFLDCDCYFRRERLAHIEIVVRRDLKIIADVEKGAHTGKRFLIFDFVDVAGA